MPFKVYIEVGLIVLAGGGIAFFLLKRLSKNSRYLPLVILYAAFGLLVASTFIPCFPPLTGDVVCEAPSSFKKEKWVALTFDDGPNEPYTSQILDILDREKVPATFFLVGKNIGKAPDVVRRMIRSGYLIGNHTEDHRPLVFMTPSEVTAEISGWEKAMEEVNYIPFPKIFRTPHGWKTPIVTAELKEKGYRLIGWSHGLWDSDRPSTAILLQRLAAKAGDGGIILLHDGNGDATATSGSLDRSQTVKFLPELIRFYRERGFRFVSLKDLL